MVESIERFKVDMPDFDSQEALESFVGTLRSQSQAHGVKRLLSHCEQILRHMQKVTEYTEAAQLALQVVNGQRTPLQVIADKSRMYRNTAERFYNSLTDKQLEAFFRVVSSAQAERYSRSGIVATLVEQYVALQTARLEVEREKG